MTVTEIERPKTGTDKKRIQRAWDFINDCGRFELLKIGELDWEMRWDDLTNEAEAAEHEVPLAATFEERCDFMKDELAGIADFWRARFESNALWEKSMLHTLTHDMRP
jgi:hypothetical protein